MRLQLASAATSVALTVGNTGTFGTTNLGSVRAAVDISDGATATGTITSVSVNCQAAGTLYVMVGSLSGTTFTVRSISSAQTVAIGLNTLTTSLAIQAGDFIGYWATTTVGGGAVGRYATGVTGSNTGYNLSTPSSVPVAGNTITLTTDANTRLSILGTG